MILQVCSLALGQRWCRVALTHYPSVVFHKCRLKESRTTKSTKRRSVGIWMLSSPGIMSESCDCNEACRRSNVLGARIAAVDCGGFAVELYSRYAKDDFDQGLKMPIDSASQLAALAHGLLVDCDCLVLVPWHRAGFDKPCRCEPRTG